MQSGPESGPGFLVTVLDNFQVVPWRCLNPYPGPGPHKRANPGTPPTRMNVNPYSLIVAGLKSAA